MSGRNAGNFPAKVLKPTEVQGLRTKLVGGRELSVAETLELVASHEHLRAHALAWAAKIGILTKENDDLMLALRRATAKERTQ